MRTLTQQRLHTAVGPASHPAPPAVDVAPTARRGLRQRPPPRSVWRERARSRLADLKVQLDELPPNRQSDGQCRDARRQHEEALEILDTPRGLRSMWNGVDVEATWVRIHSIDAAVIRLAEPQLVRAKLPGIVADGVELLGTDDARVVALRDYANEPEWDGRARETIVHGVKAVYEASDSESTRLRGFRNLLFGAALTLALIAIGLAFVDVAAPTALGLSAAMTPSGALATSGANIVVVEVLGLVSASLVGALTLRRMQGTSAAYSVPMATLLLKLPAGALAAVAGLLMIKAELVGPTLSASSSAHVMGYALLLGASQQSITGLVDRQAQKVLNGVSSKDNA
jgi:hypothetical protein